MPDVAHVYAEALFEAGKDKGNLDALQSQLAQFADTVAQNRDLQVFLFSPYLSSADKKEGLRRAISGAEPELLNFLDLLVEKTRMPEIFRIRRQLDELWKEENKLLDVTVTSAVELDPAVVGEIGTAVEQQTGERVDLSSKVDNAILGGIVLQVGNMVLDASIRSRLEKLRKSVAQAT
jgi:F-type H+-transporting ATPase subunit delta